MKYTTDHEIIDHGWDHSDYFRGCGIYGTRFSECVTGTGNNAREAYEDACEQAYSHHANLCFPKRPRGINARNKVPAKSEDCYYYVSIRYTP